jgi:hypothetical protein
MAILKSGIRLRQSLVGDHIRRGLAGQNLFGPTNTEAPSISGATVVGETLTCDPGLWGGAGTVTIAYQWLRDGAQISGATGATHVLVGADEGTMIDCRVSATDDRGTESRLAGAVGAITPEPLPAATGGTVTEITDPNDGLAYRVHTFTGDGTFEVNEAIDVEYLLVGGGGGGGARYGSGGGAGGLITNLGGTKLSLTAGSKTITVGSKGLGGAPGTNDGTQGGDTVALGLTALGGGRGGSMIANGADGGSGSGQGKNGNSLGFALQPGSTDGGSGHDGGAKDPGARSGAGGGAGSTPAISDASGADGGDGILSTITGTSEAYAGGGAGSSEVSGDAKGLGGSGVGGDGDTVDHLSGGGDAAPNTGSGGGGGSDISLPGGDGASGVVIIRYRVT